MLEDRDYLHRPASPAPQEGPSLLMVLALVNIGALVLRQLFSADAAQPAGAISVAALQQGGWWTVFTHSFIHQDWLHLLLNVGLLILAGRRVLADAGPRHFLYIYLVGGWVAAAVTLLLHPDAVLVGASGCVSAVIGAYAALHPERSITSRLGAWAPRLSARNLFFGFLASEIILEAVSILTPGQNIPLVSGVSHSAHAAGLLTGWLYARHLAPALENLYRREDFFPQGLRRRHRETESAPVPAATTGPLRRAGTVLPGHLFTEEPPTPLTNDEFLRQAVDPVLDKLYATGMDSLTEAERHILDEAANRFSKGK